MVIFTWQNTEASIYRMTWTEAAWRQGTIVIFQESGGETKNKSRVHEERRKKWDSGYIKETETIRLNNQEEEDSGAKDSSLVFQGIYISRERYRWNGLEGS